jgi:hypothetical protein
VGLKRRLKTIADGLSAMAPEASETLHGFIEDLRATGIEDRALRVGDRAPDFDLEAADGSRVSLESVTARGPAILTFYRGRW